VIPYRKRRKTRLLIIHDSHTPPEVTNGEQWLRWQGRRMGLLDIGYHFAIEKSGTAIETRPHATMGSHTPGHNHESISICLIGGRDDEGNQVDNFTPAQIDRTVRLCVGMMRIYGALRVAGHTELQRYRNRGQKRQVCPKLDMDALRKRVGNPTEDEMT